jgi:hypothetical protein
MTPRAQEIPVQPARLETLLDMSRELSRFQSLDSLLHHMAEACGQLLDSDSVGIRVVDGEDLVLAAAYGDARGHVHAPHQDRGELHWDRGRDGPALGRLGPGE